MAKIGLYFGSFNPIHIAHVAISKYILTEKIVEQVIFVVSPQSPQKTTSLAPADLRLKMVEEVITSFENLSVSDVEFSLPKPNFTIDSLKQLQQQFPNDELFIIMGYDNFSHLSTWKNAQEIRANFTFIVYPRATSKMVEKKILDRVIFLSHAPLLSIAASQIRKIISTNGDVSEMLHSLTLRTIREKKLYQ